MRVVDLLQVVDPLHLLLHALFGCELLTEEVGVVLGEVAVEISQHVHLHQPYFVLELLQLLLPQKLHLNRLSRLVVNQLMQVFLREVVGQLGGLAILAIHRDDGGVPLFQLLRSFLVEILIGHTLIVSGTGLGIGPVALELFVELDGCEKRFLLALYLASLVPSYLLSV